MVLLTPLTVTSCICEVIHKLMLINTSLAADSIVHIECPKSDSQGYTFFSSTACGFWLESSHLLKQCDSLSSAAGRIAAGDVRVDIGSGVVGRFHCTVPSAETQLLCQPPETSVTTPYIFFLRTSLAT